MEMWIDEYADERMELVKERVLREMPDGILRSLTNDRTLEIAVRERIAFEEGNYGSDT